MIGTCIREIDAVDFCKEEPIEIVPEEGDSISVGIHRGYEEDYNAENEQDESKGDHWGEKFSFQLPLVNIVDHIRAHHHPDHGNKWPYDEKLDTDVLWYATAALAAILE